MKILTTVIAFAGIMIVSLHPQITFEKTFGGVSEDVGYYVVQTNDGGYIISGWTESFGSDSTDIYLIKTDQNGNESWIKTFGGIGADVSLAVQQTSEGGYILTGWTNSFGIGADVYLIKTDANGDTTWTKTYGSTISDKGRSVQQTSDGGYIIAGETFSDVYLIKTDPLGTIEWEKTFDGLLFDFGYDVQQTADGGYIVTGYTQELTGFYNVYLIKTDANGDSTWTKSYGGSAFDYGLSVDQTSDGGYIITGNTNSFGAGAEDVYLIKTDANGDTLWTKTFGGPFSDVGYSVQQTTDGGYIVGGLTGSFSSGDYDVYLIKTDAGGNETWSKTFGGTGNEQSYTVQQTSDNGYILSGQAGSFGVGDADAYLIKTNASGVTDVHFEYNSQIPEVFLLEQNYPNPFNPTTTIKFQITNPSPYQGEGHRVRLTTLKVYDVLGNEIATLVNEEKPAGFYEVTFSAEGLPSGIYFYQ
ncbi:MAG: T9SS type A sorting domain-containing protein, partial [Candidatus Scalindua sp.]